VGNLEPYEIYAIRYGHLERNASANFLGGDPHDGPMPLDYFVWAIVGNGRTIVVDLGFEAEQARLRGMEGMALADPTSESVATLVELQLHEERPAEARRWLVHGMDANPASAQLQLLNGDLLVAEGKEEEALEAYARAKLDTNWEQVAQQRIWTLRPPETAEEKLKRAFFGE